MNVKIKIVFITKTKEESYTAYENIMGNDSTCIYDSTNIIAETPIYIVYWLKEDIRTYGIRYNFIFATHEIFNSEWFKQVIEPMKCSGIGLIDN